MPYLAGCITPRLIERLKRQVEFNGARYGVFVFSILIRAGFEIALCDEASGVRQLANPRAKHVYEKASFKVIGEHVMTRAAFIGQTLDAMILKMATKL